MERLCLLLVSALTVGYCKMNITLFILDKIPPEGKILNLKIVSSGHPSYCSRTDDSSGACTSFHGLSPLSYFIGRCEGEA